MEGSDYDQGFTRAISLVIVSSALYEFDHDGGRASDRTRIMLFGKFGIGGLDTTNNIFSGKQGC